MGNITKSKKEYIKAWVSYINGLGPLCLVHDNKLSKEVIKHLKELEELVPKIAEQKNLK